MLESCKTAVSARRTLGQALGDFHGVAPGFNAIRLTAAVAVLASHAFDLAPTSGWPEPMRQFSGGQSNLAGTAVYVFFLISGFLVTASYLRSRTLSEYASKRALRILPALVVVVLLTACVLGPALTTKPLGDYFADATFRSHLWNVVTIGDFLLPGVFEHTPNKMVNGSIWTLRYEVVCYTLLALVFAAGLLGYRRAFLVVLVPLIVLGWWAKGRHIYTFAPLGIEFPYILRFLAYFAAGMAFYIFKDFIVLDWRLATVAALLSIVFLRFGYYHLFFPLLGGYIVMFLAMQPSLGPAFLRENDYSYGFYLYAFPLQQLVVVLAPSYVAWWTNILWAVPLTLLFAVASWHLVERPTLSLVRNKVGGGISSQLLPHPQIST
jgi:peptidoglycan/LPS O-acetylase OafA/YrhL